MKRILIPVSLLTPRKSSYWVNWMTPVSASVTQPLAEVLRNEVFVRDESARDILQDIIALGYKTSTKRALAKLEKDQVDTRWTDALFSSMGDQSPVVLTTLEGMIFECCQDEVQARLLIAFIARLLA